MAADTPRIFADVEDCIDGILQTVGNRIVLALPLGLGKACRVTNALYRRVAADPKLHLTIVTALTLERPRSHNDLEKRFMGPLMDRIFGDYPELAYLEPVRTNTLPANIVFMEFFLNPGKCLNNDNEQQNYISSNYTHVVRDLLPETAEVIFDFASASLVSMFAPSWSAGKKPTEKPGTV